MTIQARCNNPAAPPAPPRAGALTEERRTPLNGRLAAAGSLVGAATIQLALMVTGVLAARSLGPDNRGHFAMLTLIPALLCELGAMGIPSALAFQVARNGRLQPWLRVASRFGRWQAVALVIGHGVLAFVLLPPDHSVRTALVLTATATPVGLVLSYSLAVHQGRRAFVTYNLIRVLPPVLYAAGLAVCYVSGLTSLASITAAWTAGYLVAGIVAAVSVLRVGGTVDEIDSEARQPGRALATYGLRGLLGTASPVQTFRLDQAFVGLLLSPAALGYYVVALAFTNLPRFTGGSVGAVAMPNIAAADDAERGAVMSKFLFLGLGTITIAGLALIATVPWLIPTFFGDEFAFSVLPARILLASAMAQAARRFMADLARATGTPQHDSWAEVVTWAVLLPILLAFGRIGSLVEVSVSLALSSLAGAIYMAVVIRGQLSAFALVPDARAVREHVTT